MRARHPADSCRDTPPRSSRPTRAAARTPTPAAVARRRPGGGRTSRPSWWRATGWSTWPRPPPTWTSSPNTTNPQEVRQSSLWTASSLMRRLGRRRKLPARAAASPPVLPRSLVRQEPTTKDSTDSRWCEPASLTTSWAGAGTASRRPGVRRSASSTTPPASPSSTLTSPGWSWPPPPPRRSPASPPPLGPWAPATTSSWRLGCPARRPPVRTSPPPAWSPARSTTTERACWTTPRCLHSRRAVRTLLSGVSLLTEIPSTRWVESVRPNKLPFIVEFYWNSIFAWCGVESEWHKYANLDNI